MKIETIFIETRMMNQLFENVVSRCRSDTAISASQWMFN